MLNKLHEEWYETIVGGDFNEKDDIKNIIKDIIEKTKLKDVVRRFELHDIPTYSRGTHQINNFFVQKFNREHKDIGNARL